MPQNNNIPLSEYPRPQLERKSYLSLNGIWEYAIRNTSDIPNNFDGDILVPFSPESPLSGANKFVSPDDYLFYKKELNISKDIDNDKIILHFTAVDQIAEVFINDVLLIKHVGGFLPFEVDIKPYLNKDKNILVVRVKDYSDTSYYSRGKQKIKRGGIWYTAQSGIYLPVWLEGVSFDYIKDIKITPDIDNDEIIINPKTDSNSCVLELFDKEIELIPNSDNHIKLDQYELWSPENPVLYNFKIRTKNDEVDSYFAMRKFSTILDENNIKRLALNNKPYFMKGLLDQGYYDKSMLTPRSDEDYIRDIKLAKAMGFNTLRKHIKIETLRWYHYCDKIGMIVWQDFVSGGEDYKFVTISTPLVTKMHSDDRKYKKFSRANKVGREEAIIEFKDTINYLYSVPSIGLWTIFNEGWGQFDSKAIYEMCKDIDNTRIYDHASGWHDQGVSDTKSLHIYFTRVKLPKAKHVKGRSIILSEAGGYSLITKGHVYSDKSFGYKMLKNKEELIENYKTFINLDIVRHIPNGLSAFIYTQLSDVEDEVNGFITYDREVIKVDVDKIKELNDLAKL